MGAGGSTNQDLQSYDAVALSLASSNTNSLGEASSNDILIGGNGGDILLGGSNSSDLMDGKTYKIKFEPQRKKRIAVLHKKLQRLKPGKARRKIRKELHRLEALPPKIIAYKAN